MRVDVPVRDVAVLTAIGICKDGTRSILGVAVSLSEVKSTGGTFSSASLIADANVSSISSPTIIMGQKQLDGLSSRAVSGNSASFTSPRMLSLEYQTWRLKIYWTGTKSHIQLSQRS